MNTAAAFKHNGLWSALLRTVRPPTTTHVSTHIQVPRVLRSKSSRYFNSSCCNSSNNKSINSGNPNSASSSGIVKSDNSLGGVEPIGDKGTKDPGIDKEKLEKLANLGTLLREIKAATPHLLQTPFPRSLLATDITLRLFPTTHPGIPPIRGGVLGYLAAARMLQMVVSSLILDTRNARIRVLGERLIKNDDSGADSSGVPSRYIMKWCTCDASETSGSSNHSNGAVDPVAYVNGIQHIAVPRDTPTADYSILFESTRSATNRRNNDNINSSSSNSYVEDDEGFLRKNLQKLEFLDSSTTKGNVLFGIFEFEFNESCDRVRVHTIQNVEILNEGVFGEEGGALPSSC